MSHRIQDKQARREARLKAEADAERAERRQRRLRRSGYGAVAVIAAALVSVAAFGGDKSPAPAVTPAKQASGSGSEVGQKAPAFTLTDAVSGRKVKSESLRGKKTLLFFSEGVNCQACMVQAADLAKSGALARAGIRLISVSTDPPQALADAAEQYGIDTPLLADPTTEMSAAYGMLGHGGMGHPQVDGHAFLLIDEAGKVAWHQAYQEMYVETDELMRDMKAAVRS